MQTMNENRLQHRADERRYVMEFDGGRVWADYATQGDTLSILHVEAERSLRGSGAAGAFMEALANHARENGLKLRPICGYANIWLRRHHDHHDVLAA